MSHSHFFQFDNLFGRNDFFEDAFNDPFFSTPLSGFFSRPEPFRRPPRQTRTPTIRPLTIEELPSNFIDLTLPESIANILVETVEDLNSPKVHRSGGFTYDMKTKTWRPSEDPEVISVDDDEDDMEIDDMATLTITEIVFNDPNLPEITKYTVLLVE